MSIAIKIFITYAVGFAVGYGLYKLKMPGGMMIGALLGAAGLSLFTDLSYMPYAGKVIAQICSGAFIACSFHGSDVKHLRRIIKPLLILIPSLALLNFGLGWLVWQVSGLDKVTAFMCAVPGGVTDVPIITTDLGGNAAVVTAFQFIRLVMGISLLPMLAMVVTRKEQQEDVEEVLERSSNHASPLNLALTLLVAAGFGLAGLLLKVPVGALLFALLGVLLLNIFFHRAYMSTPLRRATQAIAGCYIGSSITMADLALLANAWQGVLVLVGGYLLAFFVISLLLHKTCRMTIREAMLVASPAGGGDSALLAADMHVPVTDVALMQISRMLLVIAIFPQLLVWLVF